MRVLVTGSCACKQPQKVYERLKQLPEGSVIVHGCAPGVDTFAGKAAQEYGFEVDEYPPEGREYPGFMHIKNTDQRRNTAMAASNPDICIAFWNGKSFGTFYTMYESVLRNVPVEVVMTK